MKSAITWPSEAPDDQVPLDVRDVTKRFRRRGRTQSRSDQAGRRRTYHTAVNSVSFRVKPQEIYGVIGANGSGKSTLIRVLSTLIIPDEGDVFIFGHDALRHPAVVRPLLNRVSADPSFFRAMSALENLLFYGRAYGIAGPVVRRRSIDLLARLGLEQEAREPMMELSRGQQQKVAVARAFLTTPRLLLLDEPTTGLDPRSKRTVQSFISDVRRDGVAILLTTHDMEEADQLCDRLAFLAGGRIVAEGTSGELRAHVAGSTTRSTDDVDMEDVFMAFTGRSIEEDEEEPAPREEFQDDTA